MLLIDDEPWRCVAITPNWRGRLAGISKAGNTPFMFSVIFFLTLLFTSIACPPKVFSANLDEVVGSQAGSFSNLKFRTIENRKLNQIGQVRSITEDHYGNMWFAGERGVARYNGNEVTLFQHDAGRRYSLPPRVIRNVIKGHEGKLWFSSDSGLYWFEYETNQFHPAELLDGTTIPYSIGEVFLAADGGLWLGFWGEYFGHYDPKSKTFVHYSDFSDPSNRPLHTVAYTIMADSRGNVWLGSSRGLTRYNRETKQYANYTHNVSNPSSLRSNSIQSLFEDSHGQVWVGTQQGIHRYSRSADHFIRYGEAKGEVDSGIITKIVEDRSGNIWIASEKTGLGLYRRQEDSFIKYSAKEGSAHSILNNSILSLYSSDDGELWLGYNPHGVSVVDRHASAFHTYANDSLDKKSISSSTINALHEGAKGLWVGTERGVNFLDWETGTFLKYIADPSDDSSLSANGVISVFEDSSGRFWAGTWMGGLNLLNPSDQTFTHYKSQGGDSEAIEDDVVWAIEERDSDSLWIGTRKGLSIFHISSNRFQKVKYMSDEMSVRGVQTMPEQRLLVMHLLRLEVIHQETLVRMAVDVPGWSGVGVVDGVYVSEATGSWFATSKGLLQWPDSGSKVLDHSNAVGGGPAGLFQVVEDTTGRLWLGSDSGISLLDLEKGQHVRFSSDHGLPGNTFTRTNAAVQLSDGRIAMGSSDGLVIFDPESIYIEPKASATVLTGLTVLDKEVDIGAGNSPLKKSIYTAERITLDHNQRVFSLKYTALDYQLSKTTKFSYRLNGFDEGWRDVGTRRMATYTNLDPGVYHFEVKASNDRGVWSTDNANIEVLVLPPWWLSWWAYTLYCLFVLSLLALIAFVVWSKQQHERDKKVSEKLREIDTLKDEFLANTSHELRTPLHGIISLADLIIDDDSDTLTENKKEYLNLISSSAKRLSTLINDILDFSKLNRSTINLRLESVDLYQLTNEVVGLIRPLIAGKPLQLHNAIPIDLSSVNADLNRIQQILHNLIGNAIKFTESGSITIIAIEQNGEVIVSVIDTGMGIPADKIESIFSQFEQVDGSIERKFGGTGLGLAVTKQLVDLHGGHISVTSTIDKGTTFSFNLPLSSVPVSGCRDSESAESVSNIDFNGKAVTDTDLVNVADTYASNIEKSQSSNQLHIIVVDDELVNRRVLDGYLEAKSLVVTKCSNGFQLLELLASCNSLDSVSLILLDVMMPGVSGFDVCEKIRQKYPTDQLPVIFLTAKSELSDVEKGYRVGGNDYLKKPFSKIELLLRMDLHLELRSIHKGLDHTVKVRTSELEVSNRELLDSNNRLVKLQSQLVQSEKMSSLGVLVSGVGHEINNPVNCINASAYTLGLHVNELQAFIVELMAEDGDAEIASEFSEKFDVLKGILASIDDGVVRVNGVVDNLRTFSRTGDTNLIVDRLGVGMDSTVKLVKSKYKTHIDFQIDIAVDPELNCVASEINQVLMNLMINACHALMTKKKGNTDTLWTPTLKLRSQIADNNLLLEVIDNGTGMTEAVKAKVFDPFYTTKPDGEGTGLGLSISHGIILRHGGRIEVESQLGEGTCFSVTLPLLEGG